MKKFKISLLICCLVLVWLTPLPVFAQDVSLGYGNTSIQTGNMVTKHLLIKYYIEIDSHGKEQIKNQTYADVQVPSDFVPKYTRRQLGYNMTTKTAVFECMLIGVLLR